MQATPLFHSNLIKYHFSPHSTQICYLMTAHVAVFSFENYFGKITQKFPAAIYEYLQMAPTSVKDFSYNFNSYNFPIIPFPHTHTGRHKERGRLSLLGTISKQAASQASPA